MTSLIDGFFQLIDPRSFGDDEGDVASSPQKDKSYLTLYDSFFFVGCEKNKPFLPCQLRAYLGGDLSDKVIHIHGRFVVISGAKNGEPCLKIEVNRFAVMNGLDPSVNDGTDFRTSVTFYGRVTRQIEGPSDSNDRFFAVEVTEYVRDRSQSYTIWFVFLYTSFWHSFSNRILQLPTQQDHQQALG